MRKAIAATAVCVASLGMYASGATAGTVYPPDTTSTSVASGGPEPSVSVEPPVVVTPGPNVGEETLVSSDPGTLPATGTDTTLLLQIGAGAFVVGLTTVVLVRRRKPNPAA